MMFSLKGDQLLSPEKPRSIFVGGIHGVGKSTICSKICAKFKIPHLIAGDIIRTFKKANSIHHVDQGKLVGDIPVNQDILISALNEMAITHSFYVLDGHFTLFDSSAVVHPVPIATFSTMSPVMMFLVVDEPELIQSRLLLRDKVRYRSEILSEMQDAEVDHAFMISRSLDIELHKVHSFSEIHAILASHFES